MASPCIFEHQNQSRKSPIYDRSIERGAPSDEQHKNSKRCMPLLACLNLLKLHTPKPRNSKEL